MTYSISTHKEDADYLALDNFRLDANEVCETKEVHHESFITRYNRIERVELAINMSKKGLVGNFVVLPGDVPLNFTAEIKEYRFIERQKDMAAFNSRNH